VIKLSQKFSKYDCINIFFFNVCALYIVIKDTNILPRRILSNRLETMLKITILRSDNYSHIFKIVDDLLTTIMLSFSCQIRTIPIAQ